MKENPVGIVIVGAGAAGLMTAIQAARALRARGVPGSLLLLDGRPTVGAKILMSGGTRCNVTHREVKPSDFEGGPRHFVKHVLEAFTPQATLRLFEEIGVKLVLEPGGKYFPATHSAKTVLEALLKETDRVGVGLKKRVRITAVQKEGDLFCLKSSDDLDTVWARRVVLTTGGLSYPATGSDGAGFGIARSFGHTILKTFPALTPLLTKDPGWKNLSGVSLAARLSFFRRGKKVRECPGPLLFTHFGFSGPAALDISRHLAGAAQGDGPRITASFLPKESEGSLQVRLQSAQQAYSKKLVKNLLTGEFSLPARFVEVFLEKIGLDGGLRIGNFSSEDKKRLIRSLLHYPLEAEGVFGYSKAEVTAGGVDLKEIKAATMESKLVNGLYFAGEILDVDGRIGGFNFQWAWSTGALAGRSAARSLLQAN
ncbi:MAG: NAD(P)/FAD-dependent oxidoreductase [Candidatus Omnitrophica bacterium]|nr:NAD(P)/FAD-dependent oxidoreductase [Candidatus Omnitrophota bacterium]